MTDREVRFTGERTGLDAIPIPRHGVVKRGDTIFVDSETAKRWSTSIDGESDWELIAKADESEPEPEPPVEPVESPAVAPSSDDEPAAASSDADSAPKRSRR